MSQRKTFALVVPLLFLLASCASNPSRPKHLGRPVPQDHFAEVGEPDIPLVMNDKVQGWLDYFQGRGREHFEKYLARSRKYIPMMRRVLREHGMPEDLVYLSMIESGFNPHAYSRARATGAWQFIYRTGIRYGLKTNSWVDERRDPEKSTVAAAKYLKDLYDRFNDWYLAAAGYNAGEGKIGKAIRKYATEDFWQLSRGRYLKAETRNYVPKLIAAALIAREPEKYGFTHIAYEEPVRFSEVTVEGPLDLRVVAKCADVTYEEIRALNPELLHWVTPPSEKEYTLKIPEDSQEIFRAKYASLTPLGRMGEEEIVVEHRQSVTKLAKKQGVPPILLAAANGLSTSGHVTRGRSLIIPFDPPEGEEFYEKVYEGRRGSHRYRGGGGSITYRVRHGDNITKISRRTGISVASLRRYNSQVDWSRLKAGQRLSLRNPQKVKASRRPKAPQRIIEASL